MKTRLTTLFCVILLLILASSGFSQNNNTSNQWQSSFTANTLKADDIAAFQERGIQKVKDFYSFLNIICSPQYDKKLRETAMRQAMEFFYDTNCTVGGMKLSRFMDSCMGKVVRNGFQTSAIKMTEDLSPDKTNEQYRGSMTCNVEDAWGHTYEKSAAIVLCKREKKFGMDTKQVWTVFICDIR